MKASKLADLDPSSEIDLSVPAIARAWAIRLDTTVDELRAVVAEVGARPAAVGAVYGVPLKIAVASARA